MRGLIWTLSAAIFAALLAGCGGGGKSAEVAPPLATREVRVTLDGTAGPENVAILMAEKRGFFADVGLRPVVASPVERRRPVPYVVNRTDDLGLAQQPQVVLAKEEGAPVVAVGSLVSESTAAMIWLSKSKVRDVADLKGETIGVPGVPFADAFLQSILARAGLTLGDVEIRTVGYELVPALLNGQVDAIFGGSWNVEGIELESRGAHPVVNRAQDLGVPAYENLVVVARTDLVAKDPQLIRDFMSAVAKGAVAAIEDPEGAVSAIEESVSTNPETSRNATQAQVKATLPFLSTTGHMDSEQVSELVAWMHRQGLIQRTPPVSSLLTNRYLP